MVRVYNTVLILFSFLILFNISAVYGQDAPSGYTEHYGLRKWAEDANPSSDSLNANWTALDNTLFDLIANTDSLQHIIYNNVLIISPHATGQAAFTGTDQYDTVSVPGLDSLDVVNVSVRESIPTANDILGVFLKTDTLIVKRPASGTSGLKWNWYWVRRYQ